MRELSIILLPTKDYRRASHLRRKSLVRRGSRIPCVCCKVVLGKQLTVDGLASLQGASILSFMCGGAYYIPHSRALYSLRMSFLTPWSPNRASATTPARDCRAAPEKPILRQVQRYSPQSTSLTQTRQFHGIRMICSI